MSESKGLTISFTWPMIFTLVFVLLKAFGCISWSWWWVFCPLWIPAGLCLLLFITIYLLKFIIWLIDLTKDY